MRKVNLQENLSLFHSYLPVAEAEARALLLEPKSTLNTGNVHNEGTVPELERL